MPTMPQSISLFWYGCALGLAGLVLRLLLWPLLRASTSPLKNVPGPIWARFSRLWYLKAICSGRFEHINIALHKHYGPVVRIAPHQYSVDSAEAVKTIYSHGSQFTKAPWYAASGNPNPQSHDLFVDPNEKRHANNKRKVASFYSMTSLLQMESCVDECSSQIVSKFTEFAAQRTSLNLQAWLQFYAFDLISLITLNKTLGFLDTGRDDLGLMKSLEIYLRYLSTVGVYAEFHSTAYKIMGLIPGMSGMSHLGRFMQEQVAEGAQRFSASKKTTIDEAHDDFLTKCLVLNFQDPVRFPMADVFGTCITNIGAGSDTTSITLSAILYHLIRNPTTMLKVQAEIDTAYQEGRINDFPTFRQAQALPYMQACIKEGLRVHPATGLPLARVVPEGGVTIANTFFPEGTVLGVNTWVIHQNKAIFGDDADRFRPERWLEDSSKSAQMERFFLSFGAGSRTCIGKNISLMEVSKVIPVLLRRFDFTLTQPNVDLETENWWFVKQKNLDVNVSLRKAAA